MLEIFNNLFMSIAERMGVTLANTAHSVNIKERLDFSCALFDTAGSLIANAPHLPVHLGAMGESVRVIATENAGKMRPGDAFMLNNPYHGGTHLPDITVVTPVFQRRPTAGSEEGIAPGGSASVTAARFAVEDPAPRILFYVACRGHHADIGGITPGSMPPDSSHLEEEGVLIDNFLLLDGGRFRERELRALLATGPWPARNPDQNVADLKAQLAANARGIAELEALILRCLEKSPERRFQRVADLLEDLSALSSRLEASAA